MDDKKAKVGSVALIGDGNLACSIAVCLLKARYTVNFCTDNTKEAIDKIVTHFSDMKSENGKRVFDYEKLSVADTLTDPGNCSLAILITEENLLIKTEMIRKLEEELPGHCIIAVNTESIQLSEIQKDSIQPGRIIGLNWTEPAHTTRFLEIITNSSVKEGTTDQIRELAKSWNKDAYIVEDFGIRSRLMSALIREAFYLVQNGYASVEDIDRACRNDAGYYLPFAGNCRYMDLMGTYAYGIVMKDLNPDLSKEQKLPDFYKNILRNGGLGMINGRGLYEYSQEDVEHWKKVISEFSYEIEEIINKYPFNYRKKIY